MKDLVTSLRLTILSMFVCCVLYTATMLAFGQIVVPWRANGSLLTDYHGHVIGSALIAQGFTKPQYFWPRPSAVDFNAAAAGGSNLSPTNPAIADRARDIIKRYDSASGPHIPADLVTASGSGLDPHITLKAARLQLPRVATARGLLEDQVEALIMQNTEVPTLWVFGGEMVVNVLRLNLALDKVAAGDGQ